MELFFAQHGDQLKSVLELAVTLDLEQYGNSCVLLLFGHIRKVVLGVCQFLGVECDVNVECTCLCIEFSKRCSANVEGLEVPADAALNTLVGEQEILNYVVVVLNAALRLCQARQVAAAVTGYELNLTAVLLLEHFGIALCLGDRVDVIERHGAEAAKAIGIIIVIVRIFSLGGLFNRSFLYNLGSNLLFNDLFDYFFNDFFNLGSRLFFCNFLCNLFLGDEGDCVGCIGRLIEVFSHQLGNGLFNLVGDICAGSGNLVSQLADQLICQFVGNGLCVCHLCCLVCSKVKLCKLLVELCHSLGSSLGSVNVIFLFLGGNLLEESVSHIIETVLNDFVSTTNLIGNNNGLNCGSVALGFNRDNGISAASFKTDQHHANKHGNNDDQNESKQNNQGNTDCRCPERSIVFGSNQEGDFTCGNIAFNNIVKTIFAQGYGILGVGSLFGACSRVVDVKISGGKGEQVFADKILRNRNTDAEYLVTRTGDGEGICLVCIQAAKSCTCNLLGNACACYNSGGNTALANNNDSAIGSSNNLVNADNRHGGGCIFNLYFGIVQRGYNCLNGINAGLGNLFGNVAVGIGVGVGDGGKNPLGDNCTVLALCNQAVANARIGIGESAVVYKFTVIEDYVVNRLGNNNGLFNGDVVSQNIVRGYGSYAQLIRACCQTVFAKRFCQGQPFLANLNQNGHRNLAIAESLDVEQLCITVCKGCTGGAPSNGVDLGRSYGNIYGQRSNGVVTVVECYVYVCRGGAATGEVEGNLVVTVNDCNRFTGYYLCGIQCAYGNGYRTDVLAQDSVFYLGGTLDAVIPIKLYGSNLYGDFCHLTVVSNGKNVEPFDYVGVVQCGGNALCSSAVNLNDNVADINVITGIFHFPIALLFVKLEICT